MNRGTARPRVVFDCNVILQSVLSPAGPSAACLQLVHTGVVLLFVSRAIIDEVRDVLTRPFLRQRMPEITEARISDFITALTFRAEVMRQVPQVFAITRDPDDAPYIDLAVIAQADFVVTRDADLLSLSIGHDQAAKHFRQLTQNRTRIVTPVDFLQLCHQ